MPETKLLLATKNAHKVGELRQMLAKFPNLEILSALDFPEVADPVEDGETFADNARAKALYYAAKTGLPSLADDSGLVVDALDGRPGVHSARYAPTDTERIDKLLAELANIAPTHRTARFQCVMALAREGDVLATATGTLEGSIATERRGTNGFGYDPVFLVAGRDHHLAELTSEDKNAISHRGRAWRAMLPHLVRLCEILS
ncbi:MAG: RdgB/HAM1 family non-canonical purine NTP pyrophosphatase [Candidatus Sumerlaeaceae bacterium]|nr:RdgB/HAM1 family non-canonical purine NTP pyrophosphatase [Candidatus Sumerlaeaceae bacterium]